VEGPKITVYMYLLQCNLPLRLHQSRLQSRTSSGIKKKKKHADQTVENHHHWKQGSYIQ